MFRWHTWIFLGDLEVNVPFIVLTGFVVGYKSNLGSCSVINACLLEKPTVALNVGAVSEAVLNNKTGHLRNSYDIRAWKDRIQYLLDNPNIGHELGVNVKEYVERKLNPKRISRKFVIEFLAPMKECTLLT